MPVKMLIIKPEELSRAKVRDVDLIRGVPALVR